MRIKSQKIEIFGIGKFSTITLEISLLFLCSSIHINNYELSIVKLYKQ